MKAHPFCVTLFSRKAQQVFHWSPNPCALRREMLPDPRWINLFVLAHTRLWALTICISLVWSAATTSEVTAFFLVQLLWQKNEITYPQPERLTTLSQIVLKPCQSSRRVFRPAVAFCAYLFTSHSSHFSCFLGAAWTSCSHLCRRVTEIGWEIQKVFQALPKTSSLWGDENAKGEITNYTLMCTSSFSSTSRRFIKRCILLSPDVFYILEILGKVLSKTPPPHWLTLHINSKQLSCLCFLVVHLFRHFTFLWAGNKIFLCLQAIEDAHFPCRQACFVRNCL